jgi:hypothetical protein
MNNTMCRSSFFFVGVSLAACAAQTEMPPVAQASIESHYQNSTVALKVSCYYGDLYDENEKWLLSPYAFSETSHIVDLAGAPIHPPGQRGIIPIGTRFVITRVEFPTVSAMAQRMLTTPRYNPWIYLKPAPQENLPGAERDTFILLLPMDLKTEAQADAALAKLLGRPKDVQAWLAARSEAAQAEIKHKSAITGMTFDEMVASLGEPQHLFAETTSEGRAIVAWYPSRELWLFDNVVRKIQAPRKVEEPGKATPPAATH